jgi:hypothetical protein
VHQFYATETASGTKPRGIASKLQRLVQLGKVQGPKSVRHIRRIISKK